MNMMRSVLKGAGLPKNLWAEAIVAACYLNCGLELSLMCLDFESMVALHLCMLEKKREKLWTIHLKNASSVDMDLEILTGS